MKVRIAVGEAEIVIDGMDVSKGDVTRWFKQVAIVGALLASASSSETTDTVEAVTEPKDMDAHVTLSGDDVPMFGFSRWIGTDPENPDEDAP